MKIAIAGMGYVGLSLACVFGQKHSVAAFDIVKEKIDTINRGVSPLEDPEIEAALSEGKLRIKTTSDATEAFKEAHWIIVATPTDYDDITNSFDTGSIESVLIQIKNLNPQANIVIKSTIPVGYTDAISEQNPELNILFSPEFLREGRALYDNLHPSRIIVGVPQSRNDLYGAAKEFSQLLLEGTSLEEQSRMNNDGTTGIPTLVIGATEAEAVKLFSNTYLALRVSYFNELDTFAEIRGLDTEQIITGISLDPRIGGHYNNPSFGYGGYCLPKDTKQLLANYQDVPQNLIKAIVDANKTRKTFIADHLASLQPKTIGVYRLIMKSGSDNFRQSSMFDIIELLEEKNIEIIIYEPIIEADELNGNKVIPDLSRFKDQSDIIICNRMSDDLADVVDKVYTRDLWHRD